MNRPSEPYLAELTAVAEKWLRRCNKQPAEGIPTTRTELVAVLRHSSIDVHANAAGVITWTVPRDLTPKPRTFTATPVRDEGPELPA